MYVIYHRGVFCHGYVRHSLFVLKRKKIQFDNISAAENFATKFRFEFFAKMWCAMYNYTANKNFELRTYYVKKLQNNYTHEIRN